MPRREIEARLTARAILLTLAGWTSPAISEVFCVRDDAVRLWRSDFAHGGVAAIKASVCAEPPPEKTEAALRVAVMLQTASPAAPSSLPLVL